MKRKYNEPIPKNPKLGSLMTAEDFQQCVDDGGIMDDDGSGYWVKDDMACRDEVFSSHQQDATHVIWYNK